MPLRRVAIQGHSSINRNKNQANFRKSIYSNCWCKKYLSKKDCGNIKAHNDILRQALSKAYKRKLGDQESRLKLTNANSGKNKHHRGHPVSGAWVLDGGERTRQRRLFLVEVSDRTANTLMSVITTHVLEGSTIFTDCFSSYRNFHSIYNKLTLNHSQTFRDPNTGACTNSIEGTWSALKYTISPRNRTNSLDENSKMILPVLDDFLAEFQWRRKHSENLWSGLMSAFREVRYLDRPLTSLL
ncbi:hypothetical protein RF11_16204 [Thelohanellus kitauei]|uniref:ISXO2-like transposase domain-containing protein n=1 Tax=Thelohanellus kitauei TaxID=669202 RepID=A0A0C2J9V2_THEKT|nr:hypothetical protein RF11_16204 [Thelohanellus kitauei]